MMSKKILCSIVLITLTAIALSTWSYQNYLQNQAIPLQTQNKNLEDENTYYENQTADLQNQVNQLQIEVNNLQTQINNYSSIIQNRTNKVAITSFYKTMWLPVVGMTFQRFFYVTVCNVGTNNVSGLTLDIKSKGNSTILMHTIDLLNAGESKQIKGYILAGLDDIDQQLVATLVLDGVVLDEKELPIGKILGY